MNIIMMTNSYKPIVGGLENSIEIFTDKFRSLGHKVLIVSPGIKGAPKEKGVFRVPAIKNFNGSGFSVELPISGRLSSVLKSFKPDLVHSHHPFLIGDTALRTASAFRIPLIFTYHTLYEKNTHYVHMDSKAMKRFVVRLALGYANLSDFVIAPSESIKKILIRRGVKAPIKVVPTGIYLDDFDSGNGKPFRDYFGVPKDAFLAGTASRIEEEKNIKFLVNTMAKFLKKKKNAYFAVIGSGKELPAIEKYFQKRNLKNRLIVTGTLKEQKLNNAYKAMDAFVFASHSETQGLVLIEAMACGVPVVAVDAPGVKDIVEDKKNGRLIKGDKSEKFINALSWIYELAKSEKNILINNAKKTAKYFSASSCAEKLLKIYETAGKIKPRLLKLEKNPWKRAIGILRAEKNLLVNMTKAAGAAIFNG